VRASIMVLKSVEARNVLSTLSILAMLFIFVMMFALKFAFVAPFQDDARMLSLQARRGIEVIEVVVAGGVTLKGEV